MAWGTLGGLMINLDNFWNNRSRGGRGGRRGGEYGGRRGGYGGSGVSSSPYAAYGESGGGAGGYDPMADINLDESFAFNMPPEWQLAQDVYSQFAQGIPYGMPSAWSEMMGPLMNMVRTGRPVDVGAIGEALKPGMERQLGEFSAQALERADLGGLAQSSPLGAELIRESERMSENWGSLMAQMEAGAQESAMSRALSALNPALAMGQGQFGLEQAGRQEQLGALPGLIGTGWLPMQLAERSMGVGQGMFGAQSAQMQQLLNNPMMMQLLQMMGQTGFTDPQYQQGPMGAGMDVFSQLLPFLMQQQQPPSGPYGSPSYYGPSGTPYQ